MPAPSKTRRLFRKLATVHTNHKCSSPSPLCVRFLIFIRLRDIQPQPIRIQIQLILPASFLKYLCNIPRILDSPKIHVTPALLDRITNKLCGAGFTLSADNGSLLFLAGFVDDERGALSFLLSYLFGFDCCGEFGREGEVLNAISRSSLDVCGDREKREHTVRETSSRIMLNFEALLERFSLTNLATFSRCVISWLALN